MKQISIIAIVSILFISCEAPSVVNEYENVSVKTSIMSTKTSLNGLSPVWNIDDKLAFITSDLVLCPVFSVGSAGGSTTSFSGQKPIGSSLRFGLYPYDPNSSFSKSGLETSLPGKQDGSFSNAVMVAYGNESDGFVFRNVCSVVKLYVPSELHIVRLEVYRDDKVSGHFAVDPRSDSLEVRCSEPSDISEQKVVASCDAGFSGDVYLSVLPSDDKTLNIVLTNLYGKKAIISKPFPSGLPYSPGSIKDLGTVSSLAFGEAAEIASSTYDQL